MLVLSALHKLLSQILSLPELHTAVLLTPEGQLISAASDPSRPKDDIRVVVGLCGEVWQETQEQGHGMIDSEVFTPSRRHICLYANFSSLGWPDTGPVYRGTSR
jgi:hypothetical protein